MVLHIVAFIILVGMTYRILATAKPESAAFVEFKQSNAVAYAALLFPLGPILMAMGAMQAPLFGVLLCAACYLPSFFLARRLSRDLDHAGTDRVDGLRRIASEAFATSVGGFVYAALGLIYILALANLGTATSP